MGLKESNNGINLNEIADYVAERVKQNLYSDETAGYIAERIKQNLSSEDLYNKWNKKDKNNKEINYDTYTVKLRSQKVAEHMPIEVAMLLVEAMFSSWHIYPNLAITIEKEFNTIRLEKVEEDKE